MIGEHSGIHHFTLGKRIRLPPEVIQSPLGFFVASTDFASQTVWAVSIVCQVLHRIQVVALLTLSPILFPLYKLFVHCTILLF